MLPTIDCPQNGRRWQSRKEARDAITRISDLFAVDYVRDDLPGFAPADRSRCANPIWTDGTSLSKREGRLLASRLSEKGPGAVLGLVRSPCCCSPRYIHRKASQYNYTVASLL